MKGGVPGVDEATVCVLEKGTEELEGLCRRIDRWFSRSEVRERLRRYLSALVSPLPRRNSWQMAEQMGESYPYGVQRLLRDAQWDADYVRDDLREYGVEHLGDPTAVLIVDETGFLKKGKQSVGVKRQYSGTAGRIENCQVGVFLAYAAPKGMAFLDRELYLPQEWTNDPERCKKAGVPEGVEFATKPELALRMIERALDAGVPCGWITADEVYGGHRRLRMKLEERGIPFVLAVASSEPLWVIWEGAPQQVRAKALAVSFEEGDWQTLSAGEGSKGPRLFEWAWRPLGRLQLPEERRKWQHALLARRSLDDPEDRAYYVVFAPRETTIGDWVKIAGIRWSIEMAIESAKGEVGLDEYEVRSWTGWYRYITLALLAHAFLSVVRSHARSIQGRSGPSRPTPSTSESSAETPREDPAVFDNPALESAPQQKKGDLLSASSVSPARRSSRRPDPADGARDSPSLSEVGLPSDPDRRPTPDVVALATATSSHRQAFPLQTARSIPDTPSLTYPQL